VAGDFWTALFDEVSGLKGILLDDDVRETKNQAVKADSGPEELSMAATLLQSVTSDSHDSVPSDFDNYATQLIEIYRVRVDSVIKLVHLPATTVQLESDATIVHSAAAEALHMSMLYLSVCTLTDDEAVQLAGVGRSALAHRYRTATEAYLGQTKWLSNDDIAVLQALTIYTVGLCDVSVCYS
jgi:hypothetical protein